MGGGGTFEEVVRRLVRIVRSRWRRNSEDKVYSLNILVDRS